MNKITTVFVMLLIAVSLSAGQSDSQNSAAAKPVSDYSGMYTFLKEGEFVQLTIEDDGRVTGFVSRFGDLESDRDAVLEQFFKTAKLESNKLTFTTETVHGTWYDFKGTIVRGEGKNRGDEAYYALKGTLAQHVTDANNKTLSKSRAVEFKSFPQDIDSTPGKRD